MLRQTQLWFVMKKIQNQTAPTLHQLKLENSGKLNFFKHSQKKRSLFRNMQVKIQISTLLYVFKFYFGHCHVVEVYPVKAMIRQTTNNGATLNWCEIIKSILFVCISSLEMILWFSTFITLNDNLNGAVDNLQLFIILTSFLPYLLNLLQTLYQCYHQKKFNHPHCLLVLFSYPTPLLM